jgi:cytoskeleton protein RodZ
MSDSRHDAQASSSSQSASNGPHEAGSLLRQAREHARLDVAALAAMLKVPRVRIESLEAGRFDELPDGVYARSLASSICRALRVDAAPVLTLLPHAGVRSLDRVAAHKATRIKPMGEGSRGKFSPSTRAHSHVSRRALVVAALFVLAAIAVVLLPSGAFDKVRSSFPDWERNGASRDGKTVEIVDGPDGARVVEEIAVPGPADGTTPSAGATGASTTATGPATPASLSAEQAIPAVSSPSAAPAASDASATSIGGLLVISAAAPTWIKVSDAKGAVVIQKTLGAGQVENVPEAATPLSVVIGRTDTTTVQVRGEAFDLTARARNNVARFEVK